nr:deSI-like protein At4g17486 [Ipomoea batatas]
MTEVILHIYDVTNSPSDKTNNTILQINRIFKDGIGLGGIFHSAIQVHGDEEWSFGYCEQGTGVFSCPSGKNPMYSYRESIVIGQTNCSIFKMNQILRELSRDWPGFLYDLLSKNCNHFCDEFCEKLGVPKLPGWVNRFAHAGDAALEMAENTAFRIMSYNVSDQLRQAKAEIVTASKVAYRFLVGVASSSSACTPELPGNPSRESPRGEASPTVPKATWFTDLMDIGAKPSSSSDIESNIEVRGHLQQGEDTETTRRPNLQYGS